MGLILSFQVQKDMIATTIKVEVVGVVAVVATNIATKKIVTILHKPMIMSTLGRIREEIGGSGEKGTKEQSQEETIGYLNKQKATYKSVYFIGLIISTKET